MAKAAMKDVIVLLPGITGSVLQKDGKDVWAVSGGAAMNALRGLGESLDDLKLTDDSPDLDDLGDGISAPRIMPDISLIPGFWKIDGYGKVGRTIQDSFDVTPGLNYFEFAYDWRRDNRAAAHRLARDSHDWLQRWREHSGNDDARLILIAHSMGGLISRYFTEVLGGWADTRFLVTIGTPYRGSLNAVSFLVEGMKKKLGPITLMDLSHLLRSFTSVYQLLPIYPCIDVGGAELARVTEVPDLAGIDETKAMAAFDFHHAISDAVEANQQDPAYNERGYQILPLVGIFQPTTQSARLDGNDIEFLKSYRGEDHGGDGTVPRVSATPLELSNKNREVYLKERHASLQNTDPALAHLAGVLTTQSIDQSLFFDAGAGLSLDVEDAYMADDYIPVRVLPEVEWAELTARVEHTATRETVATQSLEVQADGWHEAVLEPLPAGTYRLTVAADGVAPVTDLIAVFEA